MDVIPLLLPLFVLPGADALTPVNYYTDGEVTMVDRDLGSGGPVAPGAVATIHYELWENGGKEIANSGRRGLPFSFLVEGTESPSLLVQIIQGMHAGGTREVLLPSQRLVGPQNEIVPPNSNLMLRVRLVSLRPPRT